MTIGEKILNLRTEKSLTQKQLADLCGFSQSALNLWENGKRQPKIEQLEKIAKALEVSVIDLIDIDGIMERTEKILKKFSNSSENWLPLDYETGKILSVKQTKLLDLYDNLNEEGKNKAIERVEELTEIPRYTDKQE